MPVIEVKLDDFSMHQVPTSNLLSELARLAGVEVTCVVGQGSGFPKEVQPGLSAPMQAAVERAAEIVVGMCLRPSGAQFTPGRPAQTGPARGQGGQTNG